MRAGQGTRASLQTSASDTKKGILQHQVGVIIFIGRSFPQRVTARNHEKECSSDAEVQSSAVEKLDPLRTSIAYTPRSAVSSISSAAPVKLAWNSVRSTADNVYSPLVV